MAIESRTTMTERVVQKNKQRSKASFFACCLFVKIFLCKFGALAYEVNINNRSALAEVAVKSAKAMSDILHNSSYNDARNNNNTPKATKRDALITSIM